MTNGKLIIFEGGEGGGKTTAAKSIVEELNNKGYKTVYLREPGSSPLANKIRELAINEKIDNPKTALLLFMASRSIVLKEIKKDLDENKIIIMDRYLLSSLVYQGRVLGIPLYQIHVLFDFINDYDIKKPDMEFIFNISAEEGLKRVFDNDREHSEIDKLGLEFHKKINEAYLELSYVNNKDKNRYIIDASQSINEIKQKVLDIILDELKDENT